MNNNPKHIAIIMDGNGRWAKTNNKTRLEGHKKGVKTVRSIIRKTKDIDITTLTLFAFSKDNWKRPKIEVQGLMKLFYITLKKELRNFHENDIRVFFTGDISKFSDEIQSLINSTIEETKNNKSLNLNIALGYSSRHEITNALKKISQDVVSNKIQISDIDEHLISKRLEHFELGDPDLLIRTGGESRLSDFLLWQIAYSEIYFSDKYWPDFTDLDFLNAISDYSNRERRYGKISEQIIK